MLLETLLFGANYGINFLKNQKLYKSILTCLNSKELTEPFRVNDVNNCDCCKGLLRNSPSFLSKHRKGNPGGYTEYFERIKDKNGNEIKGLYNLITE